MKRSGRAWKTERHRRERAVIDVTIEPGAGGLPEVQAIHRYPSAARHVRNQSHFSRVSPRRAGRRSLRRACHTHTRRDQLGRCGEAVRHHRNTVVFSPVRYSNSTPISLQFSSGSGIPKRYGFGRVSRLFRHRNFVVIPSHSFACSDSGSIRFRSGFSVF